MDKIHKQSGNEPSDSRSNSIAPDPQQISTSKVVYDRESNAFRVQHELEEADLKPLAENIASCGINTPLLVEDCDEKGFLWIEHSQS